MPYSSPKNKIQYWSVVNSNWKDISHLLDIYLPTFGNRWIDGTFLNSSLGEYIVNLKNSESPRIVRALNAMMHNVPEDTGPWDYPALDIVKDLIFNENYLYEDKED